jgi:transcriptional regulator with XRE-family HTH domain
MWLDNLKELKKKSGMSSKQIAEKSRLPERTVSRIFSGESDHPYADTLDLIVKALGDYDLGDIFADTNVVVATETLVDVKEAVEVLETEQENILAENESLKAELIAKDTEIQMLKAELARKESQHKDELLSLVKYFTKIKPVD